MQPAALTYERDGRVARITLDRADRLNAIDAAMPRELRSAEEEATRDDAVQVIVLAGADRPICAGYDLQEFAESPRPGPLSQIPGPDRGLPPQVRRHHMLHEPPARSQAGLRPGPGRGHRRRDGQGPVL
ncbi:MAG TPA: enoyl-CoA hydratase-related protein [Rhodocyclaceae bacterium]|nr:enoyl-CoA hydratase-related protein [Rhodocyclaceae bacterium]